MASENGHVEVVDKLLHHGATVDLQEKVNTNVNAVCFPYVHNYMIFVVLL